MASIRCFIAITLDEPLHRRLGRLIDELRARTSGDRVVRWVDPQNIHLTLRFLGSVEEKRLPAVQAALARAAGQRQPLAFTVAGCGCFPNTHRPSVVWAGVKQEDDGLTWLYKSVEREMVRLDFEPEDRIFTPHLTLGRLRRDGAPADARRVGELVQNWQCGEMGRQESHSVHLFRSELRPSGSVYTSLFEAPLGRQE